MLSFLPPDIGDYDKTVFGSIRLSMEMLSEEALGILKVISTLDPNSITVQILHADPCKVNEYPKLGFLKDITVYPFSNFPSEDSIAVWLLELARYSLVKRTNKNGEYSVHSLVQIAVRNQFKAEIGAVTLTASAILALLYPSGLSAPHFRENWQRCELLLPHTESLLSLSVTSSAFGFAANQANRYLDTRRSDKDALRMIIASIRSRKLSLGEDALEVGEGYHNLAISFWRMNRMKSAVASARRAVENWSLNSSSAELTVLSVRLSVLGIALEELAKKDSTPARILLGTEALRVKQRALCITRRQGGARSLTLAIRVNNLGSHRQWRGQYRAAIRLHYIAMTIRSAVLDDSEPEKAHGPWLLGKAMLDAGMIAEEFRGFTAEALLEEALRIRETCFSDQERHPDRVRTARALLECHRELVRLKHPTGNTDRVQSLLETYRSDLS